MKEVQLGAVIAGRRFELSRSEIERSMRDLEPEPVRDHFASIEGRRYPPKQVIAASTGLDRADFTTNQARAVLRRLGFPTGRHSAPVPASADTVRGEDDDLLREAEELRPYRGRWVAMRDGRVVASGNTGPEVVRLLRARGEGADSVFGVPLDPSADIGGFAS